MVVQQAIIVFVIPLFLLLVIRLFLRERKGKNVEIGEVWAAFSSFIGTKQLQADAVRCLKTGEETLVIMADGIGREKLGMSCSQTAVNAIVSFYQHYGELTNDKYFFRRAMNLAHNEVLKLMDGREAGASVAMVLVRHGRLSYCLAGNIRIALFRGGELIPISEGQTFNVLADKAYHEGRLSKQKAVWSMRESRVWNYIGMEGFREIELIDIPVKLNAYDQVVIMTKGIYEGLLYREIEERMKDNLQIHAQEAAHNITDLLIGREGVDNSTVAVISINGSKL